MDTTKEVKEYIETVGRRKTSIARVRLYPAGKTTFVVNEKDLSTYFPTEELQLIVKNPFVQAKAEGKFKISVRVKGGGIHSQAEAVSHGISRGLIKNDIELRSVLKKAGLLTRDPRMKERRKFGLRKARKSKQWSKR